MGTPFSLALPTKGSHVDQFCECPIFQAFHLWYNPRSDADRARPKAFLPSLLSITILLEADHAPLDEWLQIRTDY